MIDMTNKPAWLGEEPIIPESEITETIDTELLVVGAGITGLTATATAAVLSFAFGADGVAPITVGGKVVNTSGTKLLVDVGAVLTKVKNHRLVRCAGWEGPEITDVTFTGKRAGEASLRSDAIGLYVSLKKGSLILMR